MSRRRSILTWIMVVLLVIVLAALAALVLGGPFDAPTAGLLGGGVLALLRMVMYGR